MAGAPVRKVTRDFTENLYCTPVVHCLENVNRLSIKSKILHVLLVQILRLQLVPPWYLTPQRILCVCVCVCVCERERERERERESSYTY